MTDAVFEITKSASFDAAHYLPAGPKSEYQRLHGHSFQVEATVRGRISGPVGERCALELAPSNLAPGA